MIMKSVAVVVVVDHILHRIIFEGPGGTVTVMCKIHLSKRCFSI